MGVWHWILTVTGINNESSYWYSFWSAFGSDLPELAVLALLWRKINCHAKGCFRVGLHRVRGTPYITCRKHHPTHPGSAAASAEDIAQAHSDGLARDQDQQARQVAQAIRSEEPFEVKPPDAT